MKPKTIAYEIATTIHLMDENGMYCGWKNFAVVVRPSFHGIEIEIIGRLPNDLKDYLADIYHWALSTQVVIAWDRMLDIKSIERIDDSGVTHGAIG